LLIAKEGLFFILPGVLLFVVFLTIDLYSVSLIFLIITLVFIFFFRDPIRKIPTIAKNELLSPGDGKIIQISNIAENKIKKISIFLALYNAHIFRAPQKSTINYQKLIKGRYYPAYKEEASLNNKKVKILLEGNYLIGLDVIAGIAARQIRLWKKAKDKVKVGEKLGIVMFGSRLEINVGYNFELNVKEGDKVKAGKTILGSFNE